jgi:CRP/FNR family cyclic AMP-dependent transcriptional regulator
VTNLRADIGRIPLFSALSAGAQRVLSDVATVRRYEDGQVIILEGDADAPVFFLLLGTVRVYRTSLDGREQNLIRLHGGDAFNMPSAFAASSHAHASAIAVGPIELLSIPRADFRRVVSETPEIALAVLRDFSHKLGHFAELSHDLGLRSVRARLARFLLAHAASSAEGERPARWTHEQIATQIGTVREVVSRAVRALIKDGLIEVRRHQIVVLDREGLAREAES